MNADELLVTFIQQYSGLATREEAELARDARNWHWTGRPQVADADAVRRGYVLIRVTDNSLTASTREGRSEVRATVSGMSEEERAELYSEVDRRFWERTQYRPGERLGTSADDTRMAEYWRQVRDNLVRTRQAILDLPQHVRDILFDPAATRRLSPADFEVALRVGQKLAAMTATELADWRSRITAVTDDWVRFEASLDEYLSAEAAHRSEQLELGRLSARLYGLEGLYDLRAELRATEGLASLPSSDEYGVSDPDVVNARSSLPDLRASFIAERGAESALDRARPRRRYGQADRGEAGAIEAAVASHEARQAGEAAMQGLSAAHPLLAIPDFPRGRLGRASPEEVQSIVLDYIAEHRESIRSTRGEIHDDTDFIYKLDDLLSASKEAQGITPGSIHDRIIRDHMADRGLRALLEGIAVAVVAIALTIVSFGTGTLAVAAGVTAFGLSAWQAMDAFREYLRQSAAADAQLLSEDPSIAWVVLAVVGAAADLGAAAKAVRALRGAALTFNEFGEMARFRQAVEALPELNARVRNAVVRAAEAEKVIRAQWRAVGAIGQRVKRCAHTIRARVRSGNETRSLALSSGGVPSRPTSGSVASW